MGGLCHKKEGEEGDVNNDSLLPGNWEMKPCSRATETADSAKR
jgi:hypothetical protein